MIAQVVDTVHGCVAVVSVDGAEVPSHVQVQTLPLHLIQTVEDVHFSPQLSESQLSNLREVFVDFQSLLTDQPGRLFDVEDHSVPLITDVPVSLKPYPLPFSMNEVVEKEVQSMLDMGVIEKSTSAYSSPIVLVKKPDGSVRFYIDSRVLSKITVFDAEPIPDQEEMFAHLAMATYFTKIDLTKGYQQIPVKPDFRRRRIFFQWTPMPFGLVSAPATLAWMMPTLCLEENSAINFLMTFLSPKKTGRVISSA